MHFQLTQKIKIKEEGGIFTYDRTNQRYILTLGCFKYE